MISSELIDKILNQAKVAASHSWEYGTVFEALLEYHNPEHSIFNSPFLSHQIPPRDVEDLPALQYIKPVIQTDKTTLCEGNGSSADPASLGIPSLLLSESDSSYFEAATRQLNHLIDIVPRHSNGAISHRESSTSLWADFVYMVPPFLAYYGIYTNDLDLCKEAVRQCELYCEVLGTEKGAWKHIINAKGFDPLLKVDPGLWSTSNGWTAAGMSRVLSTMRGSVLADETKDEQTSLVNMIKDILEGAMAFDTDASGLLRNYLDEETWFADNSGTALLAATAFRMAVLEPATFGETYANWALRKLSAVKQCIDVNSGIVRPVVNPLKESQRTPLDGVSPEGQAFVVLLYAAWRDWKTTTDQTTWLRS